VLENKTVEISIWGPTDPYIIIVIIKTCFLLPFFYIDFHVRTFAIFILFLKTQI
jgi:hypothetical protein